MNEPSIFRLPNGIRIVHKQVTHSKVSHCGFVLDVGSRDEEESNMGIAHFWEHMAFKGTRKRKAFHILNRLDSLGGELNAFTTKEKISFYASVMDRYLEKAIELLTDITFDPVFPSNQIEKERMVILEEMAMYRDSPEDSLQDDMDQLIFNDHPLGFNILGTDRTVKSFHRDDFTAFMKDHLDTEKIVFTSVGPQDPKKVFSIASKYLENVPSFSSTTTRSEFKRYSPGTKNVEKQMSQSLCSIGSTAYPLSSEKRLPFFMLTNLLGGPALNSRLNMALRERKGFVYSIDAAYTPFSDTGLFSISFGTDPRYLKRSIHAVFRELKLLREKKLGIKQMASSKEQLMGQLAMSEERNVSFMLMMGKSLLDQDRIEPLEEIFTQVEAIEATDLMDVANEMLTEERMSILTYHPN